MIRSRIAVISQVGAWGGPPCRGAALFLITPRSSLIALRSGADLVPNGNILHNYYYLEFCQAARLPPKGPGGAHGYK